MDLLQALCFELARKVGWEVDRKEQVMLFGRSVVAELFVMVLPAKIIAVAPLAVEQEFVEQQLLIQAFAPVLVQQTHRTVDNYLQYIYYIS